MGVFIRATLAALIVAVTAFIPSPAGAHETRAIGPYELVVGWGDEPNYTTFKNSVQMIVSDAKTGKPILDLGGTVEVEVTAGAESTALAMEPDFLPGVFGEPGDYRAWLTPTRSGEYSFHFTGTIGDTEIDEMFTCGEETFDCPVDVQEIQFPAQDPSTGELAGRLDRELPRVELRALDEASSARTVGYVGAGLGAVGLIVAAVALRGGRARS